MKCVNSAPIVMFIVVLNAVILDSVLQAVTSFEWVEARFGEVLYSRNARFAPNGEAVFYEEYDSFEKHGISNNMLHSSRNFFDDGKVLHQSYDMTSYGGNVLAIRPNAYSMHCEHTPCFTPSELYEYTLREKTSKRLQVIHLTAQSFCYSWIQQGEIQCVVARGE
ncbi:hypothetical protein TW78_09445 [Vibrio coralliilyticus]|uniref:Uncharacterized protein n=1 Tax=Vibrio coralliilyticus TaxID=190893 RepID=A0A837G986_9VIBR|nr:hypothetical protein [Vibrio coralliilyticus]KJY73401.1 hypothetical protein TW78_09445 [Vibrio coralliilyticus]QOU33191.1 hypothetical protein TW71_024735 [Vibrio coralliilyticus]